MYWRHRGRLTIDIYIETIAPTPSLARLRRRWRRRPQQHGRSGGSGHARLTMKRIGQSSIGYRTVTAAASCGDCKMRGSVTGRHEGGGAEARDWAGGGQGLVARAGGGASAITRAGPAWPRCAGMLGWTCAGQPGARICSEASACAQGAAGLAEVLRHAGSGDRWTACTGQIRCAGMLEGRAGRAKVRERGGV